MAQNEMSTRDKLLMSDLQKYRKYGIFPYGMLLQITIMVLSCTMIMLIMQPQS
jgi:hypothetical protein